MSYHNDGMNILKDLFESASKQKEQDNEKKTQPA